jgi:Uma2 family endonuclease
MNKILKEKYTYQDYLKLDDENRYEIINGELIMTPAPSWEHQESSNNLAYYFTDFVKKNNLGKVVCAPIDVVLADNIIVQPDILFLSNENLKLIQTRGVSGPPDLVVEIISPSSLKRDLEDKRNIYESYKIKEYWIVFPAEKVIEVLTLNEQNKYVVSDFASIEEYQSKKTIISKILEGLVIDLKEIFES